MSRTFDNIIIGAGPGGYELAAMLSRKGESVALIERNSLGGTCLNRGCIPTKCLAASAETLLICRRATDFGITVENPTFDYSAIRSRMTTVMEGLREGIESLLRECTLISGTARMKGERKIEVDGEILEASKRLVIATGSTPALLPIEGAELAISSDDVLTLDRLPESAVIIGGGVIGMEFASIWNALGVDVTVVEFCKEVLPAFDADIAKRLRMAMSRRGIKFLTSTAVKSIEDTSDGRKTIKCEGKKGEVTVTADLAVMAVGRRPAVPEGATESGIRLSSRGFIEVDELMRTSVDGVYAIGDVNGLCMLAHAATAQARVVAQECAAPWQPGCVPSVVFTVPEVAMVGVTDAAKAPAGAHTERRSYASNGKACAMGASDGVVKYILADDGTILGASVLGAHAADLIAEAAIFVRDARKLDEVAARYIHAHPTLSEILA